MSQLLYNGKFMDREEVSKALAQVEYPFGTPASARLTVEELERRDACLQAARATRSAALKAAAAPGGSAAKEMGDAGSVRPTNGYPAADPRREVLDQKAKAYVASHPGTRYIDAVKKILSAS